MPLRAGKSQETISDNISELHRGSQYARTKEDHGAGVANRQAVAIAMEIARKSRAKGGGVHVGPIKGTAPGRTDVHEAKVADGSYILSADVVSHLGQNNTDAGLKVANHLFGPGGTYDRSVGRKSGGSVGGKPIDCILAGGEFAIPPSVVKAIGQGDIDVGHRILDHWSMQIRKDHIRTLANLPPPARD